MTKGRTTTAKRSPSPSAEQAAEPPHKRGRLDSKPEVTEAETTTPDNGTNKSHTLVQADNVTPSTDVKTEPEAEGDKNTKAKKESDSKVKSEPKQEPGDSKTEPETEENKNTKVKKESETKVKSEPKQEPGDSKTAYVKKEEEEDTKIESGYRVLEKGQVYFFYRPKIDVDQPSGPEDVQKLYLLLSPDEAIGRLKTSEISSANNASKSSGNDKAHHRLIIVPRKSLPKKAKTYNQPGSRNWAFVDVASTDLSAVEKNLGEYSYSTKTRGDRTQSAARLVAEARYELVYNLDHNPHTSHFIYNLEVPVEPGPVQEAFNIEKEGQFMIQVKNPQIQTPATERGAQRFASLKGAAAKLPKHLQKKFQGIRQEEVRYRPVDTPEFLDIPYVELLLLAAGMHSKEELTEVLKELENETNEEIKTEIDPEEKPENHPYKELKLDEDTIPDAVNEFK
ncbi:hypothetical protein BG003_002068 [Podila horticola]|nr:hypothetical protein BG003_002068 [Podila horticola]